MSTLTPLESYIEMPEAVSAVIFHTGKPFISMDLNVIMLDLAIPQQPLLNTSMQHPFCGAEQCRENMSETLIRSTSPFNATPLFSGNIHCKNCKSFSSQSFQLQSSPRLRNTKLRRKHLLKRLKCPKTQSRAADRIFLCTSRTAIHAGSAKVSLCSFLKSLQHERGGNNKKTQRQQAPQNQTKPTKKAQ